MAKEESKKGIHCFDDLVGLGKMWKAMSIDGLDASFRWQEASDQIVKDSVKRGLSAPQQWLNTCIDIELMDILEN